eukprot:TRINITY_DN12055_c0_g1_i2.p5 TRINITY_DN12055_c0_g1~~TRINITY_DN12055_c0_g1_i2.p5  ORF type:complete len:140 (+),score=34.19 TRINITY_DN12055_c0_g1_i2:4547-4966(+)
MTVRAVKLSWRIARVQQIDPAPVCQVCMTPDSLDDPMLLRRCISSDNLLDEYAFVLKEGGIIYTITDVVAMHEWMAQALERHPLFERLEEAELRADPIVPKLYESTEEGKKVYRNKAAGENHGDGDVRLAIYRRLPNPS